MYRLGLILLIPPRRSSDTQATAGCHPGNEVPFQTSVYKSALHFRIFGFLTEAEHLILDSCMEAVLFTFICLCAGKCQINDEGKCSVLLY